MKEKRGGRKPGGNAETMRSQTLLVHHEHGIQTQMA
jgi:hypothetical protein